MGGQSRIGLVLTLFDIPISLVKREWVQEEDCRMIYTGICLISGHMRVIDYKYSFILPSVYNREF